MSWDAFLVRIKGGKVGPIEEVEELPLGPRKLVLDALRAEFPELEQESPSEFLHTDGDLSIQFKLMGRSPVDTVMLEVRGSGDPITPLLHLATTNGWAVLDVSTSAYIDPKKPDDNGFDGYRKLVERGSTKKKPPKPKRPQK